jgi:D-amino-acid oxidase
MDRRRVLTSGGMALIGHGLAGCRTAGRLTAPCARLALPAVKASWDRIIRTTVGLRPHRPSGFNVSADKLDAKTVIHDYGHGGAGHSLGWGTGLLAPEMSMR